ncbi:MAG: hypothetical protein H8D45_24615 [Bacteroidetes bacterium]|nr:hypothetical protein [Bacteroidota bacterium]
MKKSILSIVLAFFIQATVFSQGCLPEGILFTTQAQIDNFQTNYPGCSEIGGNVYIMNSSISNLNGLSVLTSIGGNLWISNNLSLVNISGLSNLTSIGWFLRIEDNPSLTT